ncbi:hypothetical protein LIA77_00567 [Sarocladium implicatum]|nr:hypothetical protein LIA77_00567 [Sarocladium implicatum]
MPVDLTLPRTSSPTIDPYKEIPENLNPFALFVHVELENPGELAQVEQACNEQVSDVSHEHDGPVRRVISRWDFKGEPLRASVAYFLETILPTREWDFFYYVAIVDRDWRDKGVLLVTMDDGDEDEDEARIDIVRVQANEAGLALVNLQIGNANWEDYKEAEDDDDDDDGRESDYDDDANETEDYYHDDDLELSWETSVPDEDYSDGAGDDILSGRYWFGLYVAPQVRWKPLLYELQPAWGARSLNFPDLPCRPEGRLSGTRRSELIAEAARLHPMRCRNNPVLLRTMFMIADEQSYQEQGFLLVKIDWDCNAADDAKVSLSDLANLGQHAMVDSQRIGFHDGTTMTIVDQLVEGTRPWKAAYKCFGAYAGPAIQIPHYYLKAVDKDFFGRHAGAEKFIQWTPEFDEDKTAEHGVSQDVTKAFQRTLQEHWQHWVPEERFRPNFCPEYFIWCNEELRAKHTDREILLVKTAADGHWSVMRCPAGQAYRQLCDIVDGRVAWEGVQEGPKQP